MSSAELVKAYRGLYRSALRAVQFSKPARYVVRDQLRAAFRGQRTPLTSPANNDRPPSFDPEAIRRTIWFLNAAAASRGIEHRILRNLVRTAYWRQRRSRHAQPSWGSLIKAKKKPTVDKYKESAYDHYDLTVRKLNETMHLCLR